MPPKSLPCIVCKYLIYGVLRLMGEPGQSLFNFVPQASGKGTDTATMLGKRKYGKIEFSPGRWTTTSQSVLKWI